MTARSRVLVIRLARGFSRAGLARLSGVSPKRLRLLETVFVKPSEQERAKLALACKVMPMWFSHDDGLIQVLEPICPRWRAAGGAS